MTDIDDKELLYQFKQEALKEKAFSCIMKKYREPLYWHIRRMVIIHEDADDILQNVWIKSWNNLDNFREESKLLTWLYRIATNETLNYIEQQKRRQLISINNSEYDLSEKIVADKYFNANQIEWKLQLAIQGLPEKQRIVFNLRYYDELPYEEMSKLLDTSEGALKASYHHAVKKIEEYIKSH